MTDIDITEWRPEVICMSSGSTRGLYMLGTLFLAQQRGYLDQAHTYIGCSIGGILLGLMTCGWTPFQILEHSCQTALFKDFTDIQWTQITKEYGLFPNSSFDDNLAKKLEWMIRTKFGRIPTLEDLYEITGKRMIFVVVSLKEERLMYLDYKNSPDMDLLRAMRMTSNMPGIFGKLEHQKDLFVDGACLDPFPINYLDDGKTPILGIAADDVHSWDVEKIGPIAYFDRITTLPLRKMMNTSIANASEQCVSIVIPVKDDLKVPILDNGKNIDIRIKMFQRGYRYTEKFFDTFDSRKLKKSGNRYTKLDEHVVKGCLKSQGVKTLLRCAREDFNLLMTCMNKDDLEALFGIKDGEFGTDGKSATVAGFCNPIKNLGKAKTGGVGRNSLRAGGARCERRSRCSRARADADRRARCAELLR